MRSLGYFGGGNICDLEWLEVTIHGRTCELDADKWLMPAYANQDYPSRGIIDSFGRDQIFWESNSLHGIIFVSNTIFEFDNGKRAQLENNKNKR